MPRASKLALFATLLLAAGLRLYGIAFGETNSRARPDEEIFIDRAFDYFDDAHARENVKSTFESGWPEGYFRLEKGVLFAEAAILESRYGKDVNLACVYALNLLVIALPMRLFSVFVDLLACLLAAAIVRRMFPQRPILAATMGSLAFGCNYLAARNAHFAVTDSLLVFLCMACLALCLLAVRRGPLFVTLASFVAGLAFGVKYSAAALGVPCLAAGVVCLVVWPRRGRTLLFGLLSVPAAVCGLLLASPGVVLELRAFFGGVGSHAYRFGDSARGHLIDPSYVIPPGWKFHLFTNLPIAFGKLGLVLAAVGLVVAFARTRREGIILLASLAGALAIGLPTTAQFVRYIAPALPALTVGLGVALAAIAGFVTEVAPGLGSGLVALALAAAALVPPVITTLRFDHLLASGDTRDIATRWVLKHGGPVAVQGGWFEEVRALGQASAKACTAELPAELAEPVPTLPPDNSNWEPAIGRGRAGWGFIAREATDHYHAVGAGADAKAKYVLDGRGKLPCGRDAKLEFDAPLDPKCFLLRDVIEPGTLSCNSVMDLFDAYYVPYDGFDGQVLVGPRIQIYENVCRK